MHAEGEVTSESDVRRLVTNFDHHDPAFAKEGVPQRIYRELRSQCPVAHTDAHDGFWVASRYSDVDVVAKDPETFSSALGMNIPDLTDALSPEDAEAMLASHRGIAIPAMFDPPAHGPYRRAMSKPFTPSAIAARETSIRAIADAEIDRFITTGECNVFWDYCAPVPAIATLDWLGLPSANWRSWAEPVLAQFGSDGDKGLDMAAGVDFAALSEAIAVRRDEPHDDLLGFLARATIDGALIPDDEVLNIAAVFIMAALDTTTNAVATSLVELYRRPQLRERLAASTDATLWSSAIEELLRFSCPVQGFKRTTRTAARVGGVPIPAGERVMILWASANFDPERFDRPEELDLERIDNRHMSFGHGVHKCLGQHFARLEMQVMLQQLLRRIPDYTIDEDHLTMHPDCGVVYGYEPFDIRFTPGVETRADRG